MKTSLENVQEAVSDYRAATMLTRLPDGIEQQQEKIFDELEDVADGRADDAHRLVFYPSMENEMFPNGVYEWPVLDEALEHALAAGWFGSRHYTPALRLSFTPITLDIRLSPPGQQTCPAWLIAPRR